MSKGWIKSEQEVRELEVEALRQYARAMEQCAGMPKHYQDSVKRQHRYSDAEVRLIIQIADRRGANL